MYAKFYCFPFLQIPQSTEGKFWFHYVDSKVNLDLLEQLTREFLVIYEKSPARLKTKLNSCKGLVLNKVSVHSNPPTPFLPSKTKWLFALIGFFFYKFRSNNNNNGQCLSRRVVQALVHIQPANKADHNLVIREPIIKRYHMPCQLEVI